MAGISAKALKASYPENKKGYNGNELQNEEFDDGSGLDLYDFNARTYDQQFGRFVQIDPLLEEAGQESLTPYHFGLNNPIRYADPDGKCVCALLPVIEAIVAAVTTETVVAAGGAAAVTAVASNPGIVQEAVVAHSQLTTASGQVSIPIGGFGSVPINLYRPTLNKTDPFQLTPAEKAELNRPYVLPPDIVKSEKFNSKGGGKNAKHANPDARLAAKEKYEAAKEKYNELKSKPNKTKEDNKALEAAKKQMDHLKKKMDYTGENHSQKAKK